MSRRFRALLEQHGVGGLDGSAASLDAVDAALRDPALVAAVGGERLAAGAAAYAGGVLVEALGGTWDDVEPGVLVVGGDRARVHLLRRARRTVAGEAAGLRDLCDRTTDRLAERSPPVPVLQAIEARRHRPLGAGRPLGLRRSAYADPDAADPEPILEVVPFRPLLGDVPARAEKDGAGPSLFVWVLLLLVVGVVVWAAWLYRNAPP